MSRANPVGPGLSLTAVLKSVLQSLFEGQHDASVSTCEGLLLPFSPHGPSLFNPDDPSGPFPSGLLHWLSSTFQHVIPQSLGTSSSMCSLPLFMLGGPTCPFTHSAPTSAHLQVPLDQEPHFSPFKPMSLRTHCVWPSVTCFQFFSVPSLSPPYL